MGRFLNDTVIEAFAAEVEFLEKMGALPRIPGVGVLGRLGGTVGRTLGGVGKGILGMPESFRETASLASHPLQSIRKGWEGSKWMGEGKYTKYLPVGNKSMTVGFAAPGLHEAYKATKETPTPTGEEGAAERLLGEVGGTGGFLAGAASKRMLPGMALMLGGQMAGGKLGRIIDRMRGGASLGTAMSAPSPTEAQSQLENIQRYYGG